MTHLWPTFATFWTITWNYSNDLLFLWPSILQQINPLDGISTHTITTITLSTLCTWIHINTSNYFQNTTTHITTLITTSIFITISSNISFWSSIIIFSMWNKTYYQTQVLTHTSINNFIITISIIIIIIPTLMNHNYPHNNWINYFQITFLLLSTTITENPLPTLLYTLIIISLLETLSLITITTNTLQTNNNWTTLRT